MARPSLLHRIHAKKNLIFLQTYEVDDLHLNRMGVSSAGLQSVEHPHCKVTDHQECYNLSPRFTVTLCLTACKSKKQGVNVLYAKAKKMTFFKIKGGYLNLHSFLFYSII